jgi:hypothetical protein
MYNASLLSHSSKEVVNGPGYTLEEAKPHITAEWWQWVLSEPPGDSNPQNDLTGDLADSGDQGKYFFVAGTFDRDPETPEEPVDATRRFEVNEGQSLVIPLFNAFAVKTEPDETAKSLREYVTSVADSVTDLDLKIDGVAIDDSKLFELRADADNFSFKFDNDDNLFSLPAGKYKPAFSDGYWAVLELSPGEHTIEFGGEGSDPDGPVSVHVTDHITVVADHHSSATMDYWLM